jgi:hypothetical protein
VHVAFRLPSECCQDGGNAPLVGSAKTFGFEAERINGHASDGRSFDTKDVFPDRLLPSVALVTRLLLGLNVLALELLVWPPSGAVPVPVDRLSKQLIAIPFERIEVDGSRLQWPEATASGFVAQVSGLVCGADKHTLARLDHLQAAIRRAVAFRGALDEGLEQSGFGLVHGVHLGNLNEPLAAQVL